MKKLILVIIFIMSGICYAQKVQTKKDTLIITNYESINFIKIADKVYKIKVELEVVKPEPISLWNRLQYDSTNVIGTKWIYPEGTGILNFKQ
jgi:hypothetical protein